MNSNFFSASLACVACLAIAVLIPCALGAPVGVGPSFKGPLGLQLYSFRDQFKTDVPGTLDKI
ncbi:MAG TPA: hypothetical protein VGJ04_09770, partial [Pirellulales bacterium]